MYKYGPGELKVGQWMVYSWYLPAVQDDGFARQIVKIVSLSDDPPAAHLRGATPWNQEEEYTVPLEDTERWLRPLTVEDMVSYTINVIWNLPLVVCNKSLTEREKEEEIDKRVTAVRTIFEHGGGFAPFQSMVP